MISMCYILFSEQHILLCLFIFFCGHAAVGLESSGGYQGNPRGLPGALWAGERHPLGFEGHSLGTMQAMKWAFVGL